MTPIRLYVEAPLSAARAVEATAAQAHHLVTVMRRSAGDPVHLFNGIDGEWSGHLAGMAQGRATRGKATMVVDRLLRPQQQEPDLWLLFALLKRDTTDLVAQKATELGVSMLLPVLTERTNATRVNHQRLRTIAIEAAEQSERLTIPVVGEPRALEPALSDWPDDRPLFVAMERDHSAGRPQPVASAGLLVGPEGGFGPHDRALLRRHHFVKPISLGPRILRAETAAIVGLSLLQASRCG